jgi:hypothetical protein
MRKLALLVVLPAALAYGQSAAKPPSDPAPTQPPAGAQPPASAQPSAQAPAELTVEQTASPDLVRQLVGDLAITPAQAQGAAGTLFGLAKTKLTTADFAKVAGAVPNMDGLLKAAPAADPKASALDMIAKAGGTSGLGAVAGVAGTLSKLGLKPETIAKLAPSLIKAVQSKGGAEVAALLQSAFK